MEEQSAELDKSVEGLHPSETSLDGGGITEPPGTSVSVSWTTSCPP